MNSERWKQIKTIFQAVVETAPEKRARFLTEKCGVDDDLRREVEDLLQFENESANFIEEPVFDAAANLLIEEDDFPTEKQIGNYKIIREIGRGGMGAVFLAERTDGLFEKRVALKIIKRGMDTDAILKRFTMERQILANLDHPFIARLLDGGTTKDGLPYFVMEFVDGEPINKYCERKNLNLPERLKIFRKVCEAVSYAHQNLVVHRDLKPSNILVTEAGEPKLLDFGIAKLLHREPTGETQATETVARMLTPEYASPEQFKGERITTQSDVYSLGVLLGKLVQSPKSKVQSPKDTNSQSAIRNPQSKDLEAILETATREDATRRYQSIEAFSDDVRRFLENLPIKARRDSFFYRASKFVRRNGATVSLAALAIFALVFAAVFSLWQARRASAAQERAERRFKDVRKLAHNVLFEYHPAIEDLPNSTEVREKMLKDSLEYLDSLSSEATDDRELLRELGTAYEKIGTIQGNSWGGNLNDTPAMLESYRKSFEIRKRLVELEPENDELRRELAIALENLGDVAQQTGDLRGALARYEEAIQIIAELAAKDSKHLTYLARLHSQIGHVQGFPGESNLGETASAIENTRRAVEIMQRLYDSEPENPKYLWGVTVYRRNLGNLLLHAGDTGGALEQANQSLATAEKWIKIEPDSRTAQESLSLSYAKIADILAENNDLHRAVEFQQKAIQLDEPRYLANPNDRREREISIWYYKLGNFYVKKRDFAEAEKWHLKALRLFQQNFDEDQTSVDNRVSLADSWFSIAEMYKESGKLQRAAEFYNKSLEFYEDAAAKDPANARVRADAAQTLVGLGDVYFKKARFAEALANYEKALPVLRELADSDAANAVLQRYLKELQEKINAAKEK